MRLRRNILKGPFKYYIIKEVGGWGQKMEIFDYVILEWSLSIIMDSCPESLTEKDPKQKKPR